MIFISQNRKEGDREKCLKANMKTQERRQREQQRKEKQKQSKYERLKAWKK